jgi:signal transduction histidine kinase
MKQLRLHKHVLPLRLWLILAVVAITGSGFIAQLTLTAVFSAWEQEAEGARLASVRQIIGTDSARWHDQTWQRQAQSSFDDLHVEVALFSAPSGRMVYATAGAHAFLDVGSSSFAPAQQAGLARWSDRFQRTAILPASQASDAQPTAIALLWFMGPPPGEPPPALWPAVELGTFALTLAIVVWLVGWPVLRPLAEMSQAAEGVAGGDLDIRLPPSPVREIAEVSEALEGMSGALRQSLARQAALEEERRLFVGSVAHDLRTPLFMLRGYLKGLESGVAATPEKIAHYVGMCRTQAEALERLISDLFAFTRLEYLEQEPERAPLELGALLRETVEAAQPLAEAKGSALVLDEPGEPCPILGDRHLLMRAVENLLDNAVRHTPEGGRITVRWGRRDGEVVFAVEDTGLGIAARDLPHLFTPLYRGEASRKRQSGGAGLGLAIARRILQAHGGDLTAANAPAGGAVFTGTLATTRRPAEDLVMAHRS